jgi:hypothetical protein
MKTRDIAAGIWLRRVLVGFGVFVLLTVAVTVTVSLLVNIQPPQKPVSTWKYTVQQQNFGVKSQIQAGAVVL